MPWQLREISSGTVLEEADRLPDNWGPIFGLHGVKDQLGDLSWVGLNDQGWFEISPDADPVSSEPTVEEKVLAERKQRLAETDWAVLPDVPMTAATKTAYYEHRQALRDITLQVDYPDNVTWPVLTLPD